MKNEQHDAEETQYNELFFYYFAIKWHIENMLYYFHRKIESRKTNILSRGDIANDFHIGVAGRPEGRRTHYQPPRG